MGKKILLSFAGTSCSAKQIHDDVSVHTKFNEDTIRIYFSGCHDYRIGGDLVTGLIAPNLDTVGSATRACFNERGDLSLAKLKQYFGDAIIIDPAGTDDMVDVDDITLMGDSRGGVTTFAVARCLDDLGKPMALCADNPVSGNSTDFAESEQSEFFKNYDLRGLRNLRHAEVLLGACYKFVSPFHNKFFKQMLPLFNEGCNTIASIMPKENHFVGSPDAGNHKQEFLYSRGLINSLVRYAVPEYCNFFVPKVMQQKFHIGVVGRTQLSELHKRGLLLRVKEAFPSLEINKEHSVKIGQALYASHFIPNSPVKDAMYRLILLPGSKALREFTVEFENIIQHTLQTVTEEKKGALRLRVYELLISYNATEASHQQKQELYNKLLSCVADAKDLLSYKEHAVFQTIIRNFLRENVLFYPGLTKYIDETETYEVRALPFEQTARAMIKIEDIRNADHLAERLYGLSDKARATTYPKYAANLPGMISTVDQLGNILRFLPQATYKDFFRKDGISRMIRSFDDINQIMSKLVTPEQRKRLFTLLEPRLKDISPSFEQLFGLIQYLDKDELQLLFKKISIEALISDSSTDMVALFEQLNIKQSNQLLPLLENEIMDYIQTTERPDGGKMLYDYLLSRINERPALGSIARIYYEFKESLAKHDFKSQMEGSIQSISPRTTDPSSEEEKPSDIPRTSNPGPGD